LQLAEFEFQSAVHVRPGELVVLGLGFFKTVYAHQRNDLA
jgi:hypothetical protein